jgi:hypothetical protein
MLYHVISVGVVTGCGLDNRDSILGKGKSFFVHHIVQTGFGAHPASYPKGIEGCFHGCKAAGA